MNTNGTIKDNTPAADGEEYFATSLLFASARWGNGEGIYNYNKEAQEILKTMLHQADDGQGVNMFNKEHKMPVFCPIGNAATFSDPSYHFMKFGRERQSRTMIFGARQLKLVDSILKMQQMKKPD